MPLNQRFIARMSCGTLAQSAPPEPEIPRNAFGGVGHAGGSIYAINGRSALQLVVDVTLIGDERAEFLQLREELEALVVKWDARPGRPEAGQAHALREKISRAWEAVRAILAPLLFAQMEEMMGLAMAAFHQHYSDAASRYHDTEAAAELKRYLTPNPTGETAKLPAQAEGLMDTMDAVMGGRVVWHFQGAALPSL